jgi:hypothetical protein
MRRRLEWRNRLSQIVVGVEWGRSLVVCLAIGVSPSARNVTRSLL